MTDPAPTPTPDPTPDPDAGKDAFTQEDIDRIVSKARSEERRKAAEKYADYDDLKKAAGDKATAEERIAKLEQDIASAKVDALRATYAADVPEKLRPLLTGTTDEELKTQRDLILDGEAERKKQGNHVPNEGANPPAGNGGTLSDFTRKLFAEAD